MDFLLGVMTNSCGLAMGFRLYDLAVLLYLPGFQLVYKLVETMTVVVESTSGLASRGG